MVGPNAMTNGWDESAAAWIADMGVRGDYGREFVLDQPMIGRVKGRGFQRALDVGCGEGRFCRMLKELGVKAVGIDPTKALVQHARQQDPEGEYGLGIAEALEFADRSFDLVVSYLTLIDIPDVRAAIAEMSRVLRPGGTLLIANLNSFITAGPPTGWVRDASGEPRFYIDRYMEERPEWFAWRGIRVHNWHRPLSTYMSLLLEQRLRLLHFSEPLPVGGHPATLERHRRLPYFVMMEWQKD
jgi:SAM-dependent methyltransferase